MRTLKQGHKMLPVWPLGQTFVCKRCTHQFAPEVGDKLDHMDVAPIPGTGLQISGEVIRATFVLVAVYSCPNCGEPCELQGEMQQGETEVRTRNTPISA